MKLMDSNLTTDVVAAGGPPATPHPRPGLVALGRAPTFDGKWREGLAASTFCNTRCPWKPRGWMVVSAVQNTLSSCQRLAETQGCADARNQLAVASRAQ